MTTLQPFLFLFILAGGGIIGVAFAVATDRRIRATAGNLQLQRRLW